MVPTKLGFVQHWVNLVYRNSWHGLKSFSSDFDYFLLEISPTNLKLRNVQNPSEETNNGNLCVQCGWLFPAQSSQPRLDFRSPVPMQKKKSHVWQWAFLMPVLRDRKIEGSQELGNQETPGSIRNLVSKPKWRNYLSIWHQSPDVIFWPQLPCTYIYVYANTLLLLSSVGKSFLSYHVCVSYVHVYIHTNVYTMHMAQTKQILMTHTEKLKK